MHKVLWFVVSADSEQEAVETAVERFEDDLISRTDTYYDYCTPMESGHRVAGSDRWSDFEGEPVAASLQDDIAVEWLEKASNYQERHVAEALFGLLQNIYKEFEDSVETAPDALDEIVQFVRENREDMSWSTGGKAIREEWPRSIEALYRGENSMARYYAGCLDDSNLMEAHIMDCYSYEHLSVADNSFYIENIEDMIENRPEDAWVVPLDCHH